MMAVTTALATATGSVLAAAVMGLAAAPSAAAATPCGTGGNPVACENTLAGTSPDVWDAQWGAGSEAIQGFATQMSVNLGERIDFKIDSVTAAYTITVYRIGYYGGAGARRITTLTPPATAQNQPNCLTDVTTELVDCGNWAVSASWTVPTTAVSGVYIAVLRIPATGEQSQITFVVRDDSSDADIVFQTSDTTWQAYNSYGGSNFYNGAANGRAFKLSYNRPVNTRGGVGGRDFFFSNEYPLVRFLERNGYDVTYISGVDTHRDGARLLNHKVFLSVGHDEYWSGQQRANVEAARDAGVHLQFLSGNEVYWRTRWEPSSDASKTPYRTLVTYKETWANQKIDPASEWTGTWRDPRFAPAAQGGGRPENALTGTQFQANHDDLAVKVSEAEGKLRMWRHTSLASLPAGGQATLAPHTVGYESNEDVDNGHRPPGLIRLSTTVGETPEYLSDFGNTVVPGTTRHNSTLYRAPSGALVFSAGSIQWTWGLDSEHDSPFAPEPADPRMQQAQVNLFADMGVQPATLQAGLVQATASTDTTGPTVTITSPTAGATRANGASLTVSGTATDVGGRVAGIEVSTDDGDTWHPASGTSTWSYTYVQRGEGAETIRVRATDDSANTGPVASVAVNVACPCSVFGATAPTPPFAQVAANDSSAAELGLRFTPQADGLVTGVRFYKGTGNTGTHVGSLWSSSGELLARATFGAETATGWQSVTFGVPVPVSAGIEYVVSYSTPNGHYSVQVDAFSPGPLHAPPLTVAGGYGARPAGVYGSLGSFPSSSYRSSNYFVDVLYTTADAAPLVLTRRTPAPGSGSVPRSTTVSATFSKAVTGAAIRLVDSNGTQVAGTNAYDAATRTVVFTPAQELAGGVRFTATASATDNQGGGVSADPSWSFTTATPPGEVGVCPCTLYDEDNVPAVVDAGDTAPVTLGLRFTPTVKGTISAIRFYKGLNNTGTHTGALWRADGTQLASGTFTDETTTGWQTLRFSEPVPVAAGQGYVASYRAPVGHYPVTPNGFVGLSRGPLVVDNDSGRYTYGTGFPASASTSSYLVDVVFDRAAPEVNIAAREPAPGALDASRTAPVSVWFDTPIQPGASLAVSVGGSPVAGTTVLGEDATRLTFTPSAPLPADTVVSVSLSGVVGTNGATLADSTWTFRTAGAVSGAQTLFGDTLPNVPSDKDSSPIELGTKFTPTEDGTVRAIRFLKATGNGGTHVGSIWSSTGTRLASVTFTAETPSGWQRAELATPLPVTAGTTYVVSYYAPQGHYSYTQRFFQDPYVSGSLTAPAGDNGVYLYGSGGGFPVYSYKSTSYFADVEFHPGPAPTATAAPTPTPTPTASAAPAPSPSPTATPTATATATATSTTTATPTASATPTPPPITVVSRTPSAGATGVSRGVRPSITFSAALETGTIALFRGGTAISGTMTRSADGRTLTFTPANNLAGLTQYTVRVRSIRSTQGATLADLSWNFRTSLL